MQIKKEVIDNIIANASISEVIGHYIPLVRKGRSFSAICPFHDDHDPSLSISEEKRIYKCFVCGNGGNAITFVENFKKISFPEAVVEVSKIIGKPIDVKIDKPKIISKYQKEYDLMDSAIKYSNYLLTTADKCKQARDYLNERGLDEDVINHFEIGYNPNGNVIYKYLKNQSFTDNEMIKVNLCRLLDNGMNDVFYNRILFPIHDEFGHPVAFTARTLDKNNDAKYINTSDTEIYTKGNVIYNYHRIKDTSKKASGIIVCEGVMDVIAYYRAGIYNVCATLGTACTPKQLKLISSLNQTIVLGYDGDNAGINANFRLGKMALEAGLNVEVIDNETELDPDEIINQNSKNALRDLSSKRLSFIDYAIKYLKKIYNLDNYSDRKKYHDQILTYISCLIDMDDIENYTNELYEITKIRKRAIFAHQKEYNETVFKSSNTIDGLTNAEYIILSQMALSKKATSIYQKELGCLLDDDNHNLACLIVDEYRKNDNCQLALIYNEVTDPKLKDLITSIATSELLPNEFDEEILMGAIYKERQELKKHQLELLKDKINKTKVIDAIKTQDYLKEYQNLLKELSERKKR